MSPNSLEPRWHPRDRAGQAQASAAPGALRPRQTWTRLSKGWEAETAEFAGGDLLLLSSCSKGLKRQVQKYRDDGGAQRRNGRF